MGGGAYKPFKDRPRNPVQDYQTALYNCPTKAELAFEPTVASCGRPYRFQHLLHGHYIADFVFIKDKVIVEIDGPSHDGAKAKESDDKRDAYLLSKGWRTIRISNFNAMKRAKDSLNILLEELGVSFRATV